MSSNAKKGLADSIYTDGEYLEKNPNWHLGDSAWKAKKIAKIIDLCRVPHKTFCEVGSGAGKVLFELSKMYKESKFSGFEISPQAFEMSLSFSSDRVEFHNRNISESDMRYDILLLIDVFEHVPNYLDFLKTLKTTANYKIFHIPLDINVLSVLRNGLVQARKDVGHLHYFTKETALATLVDSGYNIKSEMLTPFFLEHPGKSFMSKVGFLPRYLLYKLSPNLMQKILGGCSLLVLAE